MKLYKNLVNSLAITLQEVFTKDKFADKAIEKVFKQNPQWGSRDRRFVAEGVYDIVRNYRLYSDVAESQNNFWFITAVWLVLKGIEIPDWQEFKHVDARHILLRNEDLKKTPAIAESYPDWLWDLGTQELGKEVWEREARAMNKQADVFIRANTLKTTLIKLREALEKENISTEPVNGFSNALRLVKRENIFKSNLFKEGWFEVQDAGSQAIGEFLNPKPNELLIDACAGAGGKSLHLAALMQNKGKIISLDVEDWKLVELKKRAKRAGAFNIETRLIEKDKTIAGLSDKADKLLLDVPCSGLGVLKRNPDAKWKLNKDGIERTKKIQQEIISDYSKMLKVHGVMVYSTCSILSSENENQVQGFLQSNKNYGLLSERTILPSLGFDGFYMAEIKRLS